MKKSMRIPLLIGVGLIITAVLIVMVAELIPSASAKSELRKKLQLIPDTVSITVYAPDAGVDVLNPGVEKSISQADIENLKELTLNATKKIKYATTTTDTSPSDYDYRLRFRTEEKKADIFIKNGQLFYIEENKRHCFTPDDSEAFNNLINKLNEIIG